MKTKYFEFSRNGGSEKYSEFTEEGVSQCKGRRKPLVYQLRRQRS